MTGRTKELLPLSERELGWLEGLIDGEGTLTLYKKRGGNGLLCKRGFSWEPQLYISNTNYELMEQVHRVIGAGFIHFMPAPKPAWKDAYRYRLGGAVLLPKLLRQITLIVKEPHRLLLLEACGLVSANRPGHTSNDVRLEKIWAEVKDLNKKGPR